MRQRQRLIFSSQQLENVNSFTNSFRSKITNDRKRTKNISIVIVKAKQVFFKEKKLFTYTSEKHKLKQRYGVQRCMEQNPG